MRTNASGAYSPQVDAALSAIETRLFSILQRAAASALEDGRAQLVITTQREFWNLSVEEGEGDRMLGLMPKAAGAAPVGVLRGEVTDQDDGWHLFVGSGPHFEFWEGSEDDYERTEQIVRAVVQGKYRYWWAREVRRGLLLRWRVHRSWVQHAEVALLHATASSSYEGGGVFPEDAEPMEWQAMPY